MIDLKVILAAALILSAGHALADDTALTSSERAQSAIVSDELMTEILVAVADANARNGPRALGIARTADGSISITRSADGTTVPLRAGMLVYQGDVIETEYDAETSLVFEDGSDYDVTEDQRTAIDIFIYDPDRHTRSPANVSVLRSIFMFTSSLIGRNNASDPDAESIVGGLGIRG